MDETYGYNMTKYCGYLLSNRQHCECVIEIYHEGDMVFVTEEIRKEHPNIPWKAVAGMRDITAHKYQTLRMEDVYTTVKEDFVTLKEQLKLIM